MEDPTECQVCEEAAEVLRGRLRRGRKPRANVDRVLDWVARLLGRANPQETLEFYFPDVAARLDALQAQTGSQSRSEVVVLAISELGGRLPQDSEAATTSGGWRAGPLRKSSRPW